MKRGKRWISLLLSGILLASAAACSQTPASESSSSSGSSSGTSSGSEEGGVPEIELTGETNKYGWEIPKETIAFDYYMAEEGDQGEEDERIAEITQIFKDEFNLEIKKILYKQAPTERLQLMLTGNEYPDAIVAMDDAMANDFISQDRAVELTPYLEKYGDDVLAALGKYVNLMKDDEGNLYKLPYSYGHTTDYMGKDFSIRNDLLKEAGLDYPDSFESYYEALKTIVEQNPTNEAGEKTYGFTAFSLKGEEFYQVPLAFLGFYGAPTGYYKMDDGGKITHWVDTEEGLWVAKYINQFWRDGLIDPDFQTKDYDQSVAFMSTGRVLGNIGTWWHNRVGAENIWVQTDPNWTNEKRMQNLTWETGDATPRLITDNFIRTQRTIITDKAEHPEWIVKYWNWETTPKAVALLRDGPEGGEDRCWSINEDGLCEVNEKCWYGDPDDPQFLWDNLRDQNGGFNYVMMAPGYTPESRVENPAEGWAPPVETINLWGGTTFANQIDQSRLTEMGRMDALIQETSDPYLWDQTMWSISFEADDPRGIMYTDIKEAIVADWIKVVMAESEEQCEQLFNEMKEHLHSLGLDEIVAYQQETVTTNTEKFEGK